jgi:hypothetical protein
LTRQTSGLTSFFAGALDATSPFWTVLVMMMPLQVVFESSQSAARVLLVCMKNQYFLHWVSKLSRKTKKAQRCSLTNQSKHWCQREHKQILWATKDAVKASWTSQSKKDGAELPLSMPFFGLCSLFNFGILERVSLTIQIFCTLPTFDAFYGPTDGFCLAQFIVCFGQFWDEKGIFELRRRNDMDQP